jgi:ribosome-associated translation inhibitor RaiA
VHVQPARVESPIEIVTRGRVDSSARRRLHAELARVAQEAPRRPVFIRGSLTVQQNPSVERRALATATIDLGRHVVRARVATRSTGEAIDLLVARLRREFRDLRGRREASRRPMPPRAKGGGSRTP